MHNIILHIRRLFYTPKFSLHHSIEIYEQKLAIFLINQLTAPSYHTHFSLEKQLALIIHALYYSKHSCKPLTKGICYDILYLSHNNQKYTRYVLSWLFLPSMAKCKHRETAARRMSCYRLILPRAVLSCHHVTTCCEHPPAYSRLFVLPRNLYNTAFYLHILKTYKIGVFSY